MVARALRPCQADEGSLPRQVRIQRNVAEDRLTGPCEPQPCRLPALFQLVFVLAGCCCRAAAAAASTPGLGRVVGETEIKMLQVVRCAVCRTNNHCSLVFACVLAGQPLPLPVFQLHHSTRRRACANVGSKSNPPVGRSVSGGARGPRRTHHHHVVRTDALPCASARQARRGFRTGVCCRTCGSCA